MFGLWQQLGEELLLLLVVVEEEEARPVRGRGRGRDDGGERAGPRGCGRLREKVLPRGSLNAMGFSENPSDSDSRLGALFPDFGSLSVQSGIYTLQIALQLSLTFSRL